MDDGRMTDGRRLDGYTISSPCVPNGSGELKYIKYLINDIGYLINDIRYLINFIRYLI